ncbi:MAG: BrnA antitoxin family protein [Gammaproteobacteria bacterium]|nr:BrnA antitoxin family protein [Gammaproteobacteria bacterium]
MSKNAMATKHYTAQELQTKKSATDWDEVDALNDDDIRQAVTDDPDSRILSDTQIKQMRPAAEVLPELIKAHQRDKVPTMLNLSPEVLAYFKVQGQGWQTRIDEILKQHIAQH